MKNHCKQSDLFQTACLSYLIRGLRHGRPTGSLARRLQGVEALWVVAQDLVHGLRVDLPILTQALEGQEL